jgi:hypothetical protein
MHNIELKHAPLAEVKPIERRANCKIVTVSKRHYLVGPSSPTQAASLQMQSRTRSTSSG